MFRKTALLLGATLLAASAAPAFAGELEAKPTNLLAQMVAWATPLNDNQMSEMRGGFAGFGFNVIMSGTLENLANTGSTGTTGTTGAPDPTITTNTDGTVNIQTAIGSFNGATGVFQIANLDHSSFNVVNQNLFVQVALIDVANSADVPAIQSMLTTAFTH
jgi:hypothetical protein